MLFDLTSNVHARLADWLYKVPKENPTGEQYQEWSDQLDIIAHERRQLIGAVRQNDIEYVLEDYVSKANPEDPIREKAEKIRGMLYQINGWLWAQAREWVTRYHERQELDNLDQVAGQWKDTDGTEVAPRNTGEAG